MSLIRLRAMMLLEGVIAARLRHPSNPEAPMAVLEQIQAFSRQYGRQLRVGSWNWRYYRLGSGSPILWLTGGLRRAALGFDFMQRLAAQHIVIAPDYPPVDSIDDFRSAFDAILQAESVDRFALGGQSYGGLLAQAYLACRPQSVERLILSSSGPADYGAAWLPVEFLFIALVRILPERLTKRLLAGGLLRFISLPDAGRPEWEHAVTSVLQDDLTRLDVVSHFAVAADLIRKRLVTPDAYTDWRGCVVVLQAANDPTQTPKDLPRYEKLFRRPARVLDMGEMGHTASLSDAGRYTELLEQALA
ncbi:MAG TPA: alpha/beta hydrolase [Anaerolineales bacterium]